MKHAPTFRFNTGRLYQPKGHPFAGQVIDVQVSIDPTEPGNEIVKFWDRSRGLDGAFIVGAFPWDGGRSQSEMEAIVMRFYDRNEHIAINYFEYKRGIK